MSLTNLKISQLNYLSYNYSIPKQAVFKKKKQKHDFFIPLIFFSYEAKSNIYFWSALLFLILLFSLFTNKGLS